MSDPYASHIPVLKALSAQVPMRHVLEFGAGHHSTPFFLSLPQLQLLVSVETDAAWRQEVASEDPRHTVTENLFAFLGGFDFVFIDDGKNAEERLVTIRNVLTGRHPVVAIHDAEVYADQINELSGGRVTVWDDVTPHTAVVWPR